MIFILPSMELKANQPFKTTTLAQDLRIGDDDPDIKEHLNSYRKQQRVGHIVQMSGVTLILVGNYMVYAATSFPAAYPLIAVGGGIILTGYLINWNSGKHLKFETIE